MMLNYLSRRFLAFHAKVDACAYHEGPARIRMRVPDLFDLGDCHASQVLD